MTARKLPYFIYSTIVSCTICIVICGVSIGTREWISGTAVDSGASSSSDLQITFNYGLFRGHKTKSIITGLTQDFGLTGTVIA